MDLLTHTFKQLYLQKQVVKHNHIHTMSYLQSFTNPYAITHSCTCRDSHRHTHTPALHQSIQSQESTITYTQSETQNHIVTPAASHTVIHNDTRSPQWHPPGLRPRPNLSTPSPSLTSASRAKSGPTYLPAPRVLETRRVTREPRRRLPEPPAAPRGVEVAAGWS